MHTQIIADVTDHEARVALLEDGRLAELQVELSGNERLVGNIYKGRVQNVLPGMQAAFVDIGLDRNAFLYVGDILVDKSDFFFENETSCIDKEFREINIKDIVKKGQEILVQVLKQPGGTKGARITTHITIPGRNIVLMPTVDHVGVSRKIEDEKERERLRGILEKIRPAGMGVIVRTAAVGVDEEELKSDLDFLNRMWKRVQQRSSLVSAPRLIRSEETLMYRTVRDMFKPDVDKFIINDRECYERVLTVAEITQPEISDRIEYYDKDENIFDYYGIENRINAIFDRKVWLDSGAYLVIDEAEALTAIDVNTGKYIGDDDLQETILNANIEAARKIAEQIRLRDIGGIVIIDFIDMDEKKNEDKVVEVLREELKKDRTKTNVLGFTGLGLVEMTRKKVRMRVSALLERSCRKCKGSGKVLTPAAVAIGAGRAANRVAVEKSCSKIVIEVSPEVSAYILSCNERGMRMVRSFQGKTFYVCPNDSLDEQEYKVSPLVDSGRFRNLKEIF